MLATAYQAEKTVERAVRQLGMPAWVGRHEDATRRVKLMFPRYVLFQADLASNDRWRSLYTEPGVEMVLGTRGERPTPLRVGALDALFDACAADGVIYRDRAPVQRGPPIAKGREVMVTTGRFAGWKAVCQWSTDKRVGVLLTMFGHEVRMSLPPGAVEAVPGPL